MKLTEADRERKSAKVTLVGAKKQAVDQHQHLYKAEEQLAIAHGKIESQQKEMEKEEVVAQVEQAEYDVGVKETEETLRVRSQKSTGVVASECGPRH